MKWFRLYSELLHDPKVQRLPPALFKHWINLLCLANESTPRGVLPLTEDVAFALRLRTPETARILVELHSLGLLDKAADDRYMPHNWPERQRNSDDVAARVRRYRNGAHEDPPPEPTQEDMLPVTLQDTLPVTGAQQECIALDTDRDQIQTKKQNRSDPHLAKPSVAPTAPACEETKPPDQQVATIPVDNFTPFAARCWAAYPARNGKKLHKADFVKRLKAIPSRDWDAIEAAITHYAASSQVLRGFAEDPHRFLTHWTDWTEPETPTIPEGDRHDKPLYQTADERRSDSFAGWDAHYRRAAGNHDSSESGPDLRLVRASAS